MTACSTALGLGMMPLLLYLYSQGFSNLAQSVPFTYIIFSLTMILVPCGIGILINYRAPQYSKIITKVCVNPCMEYDTAFIQRFNNDFSRVKVRTHLWLLCKIESSHFHVIVLREGKQIPHANFALVLVNSKLLGLKMSFVWAVCHTPQLHGHGPAIFCLQNIFSFISNKNTI